MSSNAPLEGIKLEALDIPPFQFYFENALLCMVITSVSLALKQGCLRKKNDSVMILLTAMQFPL